MNKKAKVIEESSTGLNEKNKNDKIQKIKMDYIKLKELYCFKADEKNIDKLYKVIDDMMFCEEPDYISENFKINIEEFEVSFSKTNKKNKELSRIVDGKKNRNLTD